MEVCNELRAEQLQNAFKLDCKECLVIVFVLSELPEHVWACQTVSHLDN